MRLVLLDTSFLLLPFEKGTDIFGEIVRVMSEGHELAVPQSVINELEAMTKSAGRRSIAARSALGAIEKRKLAIIGNKQAGTQRATNKNARHEKVGDNITADAWFLRNAKAMGAVVCTMDADLKNLLRAQGVHVIILMDKSHLGFA